MRPPERMAHAPNRYVLPLVFLLSLTFPACTPAEPPENPDAAMAAREASVDGEAIYLTRCQSCHKANGEGIPGEYPPLQNSEYVAGDKERVIRVLLHGLRGEITVNGASYSGVMPPWGDYLDDEQLAALLTFLRSHFGNDADPVSAAEVARVRAAAERQTPWTADELERLADPSLPLSE